MPLQGTSALHKGGNQRCTCSLGTSFSLFVTSGLLLDLTSQRSQQNCHPIKEKRSSTEVASLLNAGKQLWVQAGLSLSCQNMCSALV